MGHCDATAAATKTRSFEGLRLMNHGNETGRDFGYPWLSDDGIGGYVNPILFADYSDPDAIRIGDDFWMTASSFNCTPGLPILHSRDLVNWSLVGHALKNLPDPSYAQVRAGCGVWAPSIRYHAGRCWIFFPTPDEGIYVVTAPDPRGPWTEPYLLQAGKGLIDPCPLWDGDGRAYLVFAYAGSRAGIKDKLDIREMDPAGTQLIGPAHTIFNDPVNHPTAEGPKFYRREGWYYVFAPAGGVGAGWQLVLRSRNIFGPYEHRIVLAQGRTSINGPHQGALVDTPSGQDCFIHFQEWQPYGRIVHLQPVTWTDGWPLIGQPSGQPGIGEPVPKSRKPVLLSGAPCAPATSDSFDGVDLGKQWQWHANYQPEWASLTARRGWLRLAAMPAHPSDLSLTPHLLLQKFPAASFTVETRVQLTTTDTSAGMAVIGLDSAALLLSRNAEGNQVRLHLGNETTSIASTPGDTVDLRVTVHAGGQCSFACRTDAGWVESAQVFQAREGKWIGAKIGLVAVADLPGRFADFQHFRFTA
jgi:beta-xylosidase